ncbi:hypothetical protein COU76_01500 [Candidatus Peregrinibacteria bacterium CG10_big_fil_rev_8_21_14_0_10_49_10]|nr:MAG: hypothetical protein COU76_01500 [Candidatus Peregrinibacteria bacterium CG10_big_fil_rev_8_21_14_0_10_49_10]
MTNSKVFFIFFMALTVLFELAGDYLFKKWSLTSNRYTIGAGLLMYFIGTVFWAFSLKHEELSQAIIVFVLLTMIGAVLIGSYLFGEHATLLNKLGILLALLSVVMIEW